MNKGSQLNKESGVSNEQENRWSQSADKESRVSNELGVSAEQGVRGFIGARGLS